MADKKEEISFNYPSVRRDDNIVDNYHGIEIKDPYRWMEDPDSPETKAYVDSQNEITEPYIKNCKEWNIFNEKLTKLWNYPKYGCPMKHGKFYFFYMNTGIQNHSVLYMQETLKSEPKVFLDPNLLSEDGTVALSQKSFSEDGSYMAYGLSSSGSDWIKIHIRKVETGVDFEEILDKVKFTDISWTKDNKGFFYARYADQDGKTDGSETQINENQKLYYHRIGESQEKDTLIAEFPEEPSWRIQSVVSDCGKYLILPIVKDCRDNIIYFCNIENNPLNAKLNVQKVVEKFESDYDYITNFGSRVYFRTNKNAPNYQVIAIDFDNPGQDHWKTIIPEHNKNVLDWVKCVHEDKLLLCYIEDVKSTLQVNSLHTGELIRKFSLDIGTIIGVSGKRTLSEIFYNFSSFLNPGTIYRYDFQTPNDEPEIFRKIELNLDGYNSNDYKIDQVFYESKDGTKIPMFIISKHGNMKPKPCLLYGYGGFNISLQPTFGINGLMFMSTFNGILAYPNIRGGGEYGEKWHNSGRLFNKQNVFDDFQAAAMYLMKHGYTTKEKLVIQGASNGGLLVGACINQSPNLFGAAILQVGVLDMLRFHKFTIGQAWCSDYGNPNEKAHFENLLKYSPLHNVHNPKSAEEEYPATLILTADHDDRVSPLHSLKFAAELQNTIRDSSFQKRPILLRVYKNAGHGSGKPTAKRIEEATDILTFVYKNLQIELNL